MIKLYNDEEYHEESMMDTIIRPYTDQQFQEEYSIIEYPYFNVVEADPNPDEPPILKQPGDAMKVIKYDPIPPFGWYREFYSKVGPLVNPEYGIDISKLRIKQRKDLPIDFKLFMDKLDEDLGMLNQEILQIFNENKVPIVIGGSKDLSKIVICGFIEKYKAQNKKLGIISMICKPDVRVYSQEEKKIKPTNSMTQIFKQYKDTINNLVELTYICGVDYQDFEFDKDMENKPNIVYKKTHDLKKTYVQPHNMIDKPQTSSGFEFFKLLRQMQKDKNIQDVYLSISESILSGSYEKSVFVPNRYGGLNQEEIFEIMFQAGASGMIRSIDITDFILNKDNEYINKLIVCNMLYYYFMGQAHYKNQVQKNK